MALNKAGYKTAVKNAFLANIPSPTAEQQSAIDALAGALADAAETFVKSATVTVALGIPVQVAVPAGTGATTGTGTASIT